MGAHIHESSILGNIYETNKAIIQAALNPQKKDSEETKSSSVSKNDPQAAFVAFLVGCRG